MLAYCDRPWNEPIAKMAPRYGEATPLRLAANAVMAGCKPEYFPLFMLAHRSDVRGAVQPLRHAGDDASVRAAGDSQRPGRAGTRHQRRSQRVRAGHAAPTRRSAARCGWRCVNIGGAIPALGDMSTFGAPSKFSYLRRRERGGKPVGAAARRARVCRKRRPP